MKRRDFLRWSLSGAVCGAAAAGARQVRRCLDDASAQDEVSLLAPAYAVVPVVADGKWVWKDPPTDQKGYLEPRTFEASIGMELQARGPAAEVRATTAVPAVLPEQRVEDLRVETDGCAAEVRQLAPEAFQLILAAPAVVAGQVLRAVAHFRLTLFKDYQAFSKDQFPVEQEFPKDFRKVYLYDSPGIQTRQEIVKKLAAQVGGQLEHPWDKAQAFHEWVWENIKAQRGYYTSVVEAIRKRVGDCEERAAVFVALCRASGIPARLVWVPNHNWAEFCLKDNDGQPHWIPSHTSAYSWFGWTGAHEMVLQKGDSIPVPEKKSEQRLMADWLSWQGMRLEHRFYGELKPVATTPGEDAGPGARSKSAKGEWVRVGTHPMDKYARE